MTLTMVNKRSWLKIEPVKCRLFMFVILNSENQKTLNSKDNFIFIDLFSKLAEEQYKSFKNIVHHRVINRDQYGLISKKKASLMLTFFSDYKLRWWRLPIAVITN